MKWQLAARPCPLCNTETASRLYAEENLDFEKLDDFAFASRKVPEYMHARLMECRACDLVYANPAPSVSAIGDAYCEAAFDSGDEARLASRTYARFLPLIQRQLPDARGALDIGTGEGSFLRELLDAGFSDVAGVEPSRAPVATASDEIRRLIRQGLFRDADFEPESLSLVTCFQTIEHLADPLSMCRAASRILKPGGALFVIGHNRRSLSARVLGRKSPIYDIEHLQLFSPASLRHMLAAAGFTGVRIAPLWNCYPLRYWTRLFPLPRRLKDSVLRGLEATALGNLPVKLPAGNLVAIGFKNHANESHAARSQRSRPAAA